MNGIVNKVDASGLVTIDLENFYDPAEKVVFDIRPHLFMELILKEKEFRDFVKQHDWSVFKDKVVAITNTAEAIVPTWAFMLLTLALQPWAKKVFFGSLEEVDNLLFQEKLQALHLEDYRNARVVIKGCGEKPVPLNAYVQLTALLQPVVKSIMYGEPCSTVPLYKSKV